MRAWLVLAVAACGDNIRIEPTHYELGTCGVVDILAEEPGVHMPAGSDLAWATNPPASGAHFPVWPAYDRSYTALARGHWLHGAEHGAVVFLHRCDNGCPAEIAMLEDAVRVLPVDPKCAAPVKHRAIVTSDPLLPEDGFAAIAWGVAYTASCVDPDALATFAADFYARAPENTCANGASLGGTPIE